MFTWCKQYRPGPPIYHCPYTFWFLSVLRVGKENPVKPQSRHIWILKGCCWEKEKTNINTLMMNVRLSGIFLQNSHGFSFICLLCSFPFFWFVWRSTTKVEVPHWKAKGIGTFFHCFSGEVFSGEIRNGWRLWNYRRTSLFYLYPPPLYFNFGGEWQVVTVEYIYKRGICKAV